MKYLALDIESTGLSPDSAQMIEIGAVVVENGREQATFSKLIGIGQPLPSRIVELTGITDRMLKDQAGEREVMKEFLQFCEENCKECNVILGHNVSFDFSFLKTAAVLLGDSFERQGIDTLKIARVVHPEIASKTLDSMCDYYQIKRSTSHRAFEDAKAAAELFECMKERYASRYPEVFAPITLTYTPKKQEPITEKQKKYLIDLVKYHKLEIPPYLEEFTKSKASRYIDKIILDHGMLSRR
jgi:DNA polymerase-3 subunit alpha (Gram-positive type)